MVFTKAWSDVKLPSRPDEEIRADGMRLDAVAALMPRDMVRSAVTPYLVAIHAARLSGNQDASYPDYVLSLVSKIKQGAKGDWPAPSPRRVAEESRTATRELTRFWVDCLHLAWGKWGQMKGSLLLGTDDMMPVRPDADGIGPLWKRWESVKNTSLAELLCSVALTKDDLPSIMRAFGQNVRDKARKEPLLIPDRLEIVAEAAALVLRRQHF